VPTWAGRAAAAGALGPTAGGLDPLALRRRLTVRAGLSALTVDESALRLRRWWRRVEIPWSEVTGFEESAASGGQTGRLVARTAAGSVPLPATRRRLAELHDLHTVLDAYRRRAELLADR
jgi:hypothetical protein